MLKAVQLKPDVYWVGAIDWNERNFHGYTMSRGTTYNAYLILDQKVTLIDCVKGKFADELIQRVSSVIDPSKIDVIICNHAEMDHSGALPAMKALAPDAEVYASAPMGVKNITGQVGDFGIQGVKDGETINIGARDLTFVHTKMVHWPDNMVTLDAYDKILFSNDAFGQHIATSGRFDDENDLDEVMASAHKYYANIVQPYRAQAAAATAAVCGLPEGTIDMIAPAHGIIWRSHVDAILDAYKTTFTSGALKEEAVVAYDTMWASTGAIATAIADAFAAEGVQCRLMDLKDSHISDAADAFLEAKYLAVGSPTLNMQMMPNAAALLTYIKGLSPKNDGRKGIAFGSYGWSPVGIKNIAAELEGAGFDVAEPIACQWVPTSEYLDGVAQTIHELVAGE